MAFTFAGQYTQEMLAAVSGVAAALPLLSVNVYQVGTTMPVTLYTSRTKAAGANPVSTDVNSNLTFFVDPGQYDLVFTPPGGTQKRVTISVPTDAAEGSVTYAPITGSNQYARRAKQRAESIRLKKPDQVATVPGITATVGIGGGATGLSGTLVQTFANTSPFRYSSCRVADQVPGSPFLDAGFFWRGRPPFVAGSGTNPSQPFMFDYMASAADHEMEFVKENTKCALELWVDGIKVIDTTAPSASVGQGFRVRITDSQARPRHIRFRTMGMDTNSTYAVVTASFWRPQGPLYQAKFGWLGDSYIAGSQDSNGRGFAAEVGDLLGIESVVNGWSGTGYVADNGAGVLAPFPARVADFVGEGLDALVIVGSQNDDGLSGIQTAAALTLSNASSLLGAPVFVFGPGYMSSAANAPRDTNTAAVKAACDANAQGNVVTFTDMKGWITGTGNTGSPAGNGNADLFVATDGVHPNDAGHKYMAWRMAQAIAATYPNSLIG